MAYTTKYYLEGGECATATPLLMSLASNNIDPFTFDGIHKTLYIKPEHEKEVERLLKWFGYFYEQEGITITPEEDIAFAEYYDWIKSRPVLGDLYTK